MINSEFAMQQITSLYGRTIIRRHGLFPRYSSYLYLISKFNNPADKKHWLVGILFRQITSLEVVSSKF